MTSKFTITNLGNCRDSVQDCSEYSTTPILSSTGYTYEQTCTIDILKKLDNTTEITDYSIDNHENATSIIKLAYGKDGLYEIDHIILPNMKWLEQFQNEPLGEVYPNGVYLQSAGVFYKYAEGELTEVTIEQIAEVNPENTTINKVIADSFSICALKECYYNIAKKLLSELCPLSCSKEEFKEDIFKRDLIWMAINVITYCVELGDYESAMVFLKQIETCGGVCPQEDKSNKHSGCGCTR